MTIVNAALASDEVIVMTDTMVGGSAVSGAQGFGDKVHLIAHAGVLIAGRGVSSIWDAWARIAGFGEPGAGIDALTEDAPHALRAAYRCYDRDEMIAADCANTVVYGWGWSDASGRFVGYQHDSRRDFAPEPMADGLMIGPGLLSAPPPIVGLDGLKDVALLQHAQDRETGCDQIGGDLLAYRLQRDGDATSASVTRLLRFPSFEDDLTAARASGAFRTRQHLAVIRGLKL